MVTAHIEAPIHVKADFGMVEFCDCLPVFTNAPRRSSWSSRSSICEQISHPRSQILVFIWAQNKIKCERRSNQERRELAQIHGRPPRVVVASHEFPIAAHAVHRVVDDILALIVAHCSILESLGCQASISIRMGARDKAQVSNSISLR